MHVTRKHHRRRTMPSTLARLPLTAAIYLAFGSMACGSTAWAQSVAQEPQATTTDDALTV